MVINLARRCYCDAGYHFISDISITSTVCLSDCLWVCVCVSVCPQLSQYNFVKCGTIVTLDRDNRLYSLNPGGSILKIYWWGFALAY